MNTKRTMALYCLGAVLCTFGLPTIRMQTMAIRNSAIAKINSNEGTQVSPGRLPPLNSIDFVTANNGWAGGSTPGGGGEILVTKDGGRIWYRQFHAPSPVLRLHFVNSLDGWAVTTGGLLRTTDGGRTWSSLGVMVQTVDFVNPMDGWAITGQPQTGGTSGGHLMHTVDGGVTWRDVPSVPHVDSVSFATPKDGFITNDRVVMETRDGGRSWTTVFRAPLQQFNPLSPWSSEIVATQPADVWVLFYGGAGGMSQEAYAAFRSVDRGKTWTPLLSEPGFRTMMYPSIHTKYAIDGYAGAFAATSGSAAFFSGSCPACYGWGTVSMTSTITGGRTWFQGDIPGIVTASNPAVSFINSNRGWMVVTEANRGLILETSDSGRNWAYLYPADFGQQPGKAAPIKPLPITLGGHIANVNAPDSLWQDGMIRADGRWQPYYVWTGSTGASPYPGTPFVAVTNGGSSVYSPLYMGRYPYPRGTGKLLITGFRDHGALVEMKTTVGKQVAFDLRTRSWIQ